MKILVFCPLNEEAEPMAMNLMVSLNKKGINALSVPNFKDYLVKMGMAANQEEAIFKALTSATDFASVTTDCVIIGNSKRSIKYDVLIEMNVNNEEGVKQTDYQLEKMREKYRQLDELSPILSCYKADDCESHLGGGVERISQFIEDIWTITQNKA